MLSAMILIQSCTAWAGEKEKNTSLRAIPQPMTGEILADRITKFGNVELSITREDMLKAGYKYGDVVTFSFMDKTVDLPFCSNFTDVDTGEAALVALSNESLVMTTVNMGNFALIYGVAEQSVAEDGSISWTLPEGVKKPVQCTVAMKEPGGYYAAYMAHQLSYTDERSDYPELNDEQFANFRVIETSGMGKNTLYRTSSPVDPLHKRNTYADAAIRNHGVDVILNLGDDKADLQTFPGYKDSYYSTVNHLEINLGMDFTDEVYGEKLSKGLRYMAANPGIYAIHCLIGKDRTGLVCALLECFMGASLEEVISDYMVTFYNFYRVKPGDAKYNILAGGNIRKSLQGLFGVDDLETVDLSECAANYIESIGLTDEELENLKANLAADHEAALDKAA